MGGGDPLTFDRGAIYAGCGMWLWTTLDLLNKCMHMLVCTALE